MNTNDELIFANEEIESTIESLNSHWSILVVDDDKEVHAVTKLALNDFEFNDKKLNLVSAYSAKEAKDILSINSAFAVVFLDVVMESNEAGFEVVDFIRDYLKNSLIRIIIRTGQPGYAPEQEIIDQYDINDYKEKTELTITKLYTTTRTALSQYKQIIELEKKKNEIYEHMIRDSITNLFSRPKLYNDLSELEKVGLILLDVDSFSTINNAYGYDIGDRILIEISEILKSEIEEQALIYRVESDKFILLFREKNDTYLEDVAFRIKKRFAEHQFKIDDLTIIINISMGIVNYPHDNLLQKSEIAINASREKQDNKIEFYSEKIDSIKTINNNLVWSKRLSNAISSNDILTYFQPIVDCKTEKIVKYEALVRLNYEGEIYSPFHFLGAAKNAGLLTKITDIVFRQSCKAFSNNHYNFSVNITNFDLMDKSFVKNVLVHCKDFNVNPSRISIEILEDSSIGKNAQAQNTLKELKKAGFLISIDDFGIEYSNFSQLNSLEVDNIKIDGSFIKNITTDKNSQYITEAIVSYTKYIDVKTIAEFVHSREVFEKIKELGVDYAQGYYFGQPQPELVIP